MKCIVDWEGTGTSQLTSSGANSSRALQSRPDATILQPRKGPIEVTNSPIPVSLSMVRDAIQLPIKRLLKWGNSRFF